MLNEQTLNALLDLFSEGKNEVWIGTWRSPMKIEVAEDIATLTQMPVGELIYVDGRWEGCGFSLSNEDLVVMMNDNIITKCPNVTASNALVRVVGLLYHTNVDELDADVRAILKELGTANFIAICKILKLSGGDSLKLEALQIGALCIGEEDELDIEMITLAAEIMLHALDFIDTLLAV